MTDSTTQNSESQTAQQPRGYPVQLRFCYYLRMSEAKPGKAEASNQRVFKIPAYGCWVVVPQKFGGGWFAILPLVSDEQISVERKKGLQANLRQVSPSPSDSASYVLDIPERYPEKLLRDAELKWTP